MQTHLDTRAETRRALLLLGPTGSGKSPLGDLLEAKGLGGAPCLHLDFGALLRGAAEGRLALPGAFRRIVIDALEAGRLLTDAELPVADALITSFLVARAPASDAWVVLNGIPRHELQVETVGAHFDIRRLVHLDANADVLLDRIRHDVGGDREGREDDDPARVLARIRRFEARTRPLLAFYAAQGVATCALHVGVGTSPAELLRQLEGRIEG